MKKLRSALFIKKLVRYFIRYHYRYSAFNQNDLVLFQSNSY